MGQDGKDKATTSASPYVQAELPALEWEASGACLPAQHLL